MALSVGDGDDCGICGFDALPAESAKLAEYLRKLRGNLAVKEKVKTGELCTWCMQPATARLPFKKSGYGKSGVQIHSRLVGSKFLAGSIRLKRSGERRERTKRSEPEDFELHTRHANKLYTHKTL